MPEVTYYVASSLDGCIATTDGGVDWLMAFQRHGEDHGYGAFYASVDALVLGSRSYEFALGMGSWRSPDKPSWVFTSRELPVAHPSITLTAQAPSEVMKSLADRGLKHVWLMGGGKLAASFRASGLITRYMIAIVPVVLGGGIPLFADAPRRDSLRLVEAKPYSSGIVMLTYEPTKNGKHAP